MNGKDIFLGLRYVETALIEEAENGTFPKNLRQDVKVKRGGFRKPLLIAAVIALAMLLVGCGVVYVLGMQNLKIGESVEKRQMFNERQEYVGEETVSQQVLTLSGLKGSPNYLAAQEWFEFKKNYDPDYALLESIKHDIPRFPAEYDSYGPYSQEMVDKLDEIVEKYGLELMGARVTGKTGKSLFDYLGTDDFLLPNVPAKTDDYNGWYYQGGYCYADMKIQMEGEGAWPYHTLLSYYYSPKKCFDDTVIALDDNGDWTERNYTTASGNDLLILRSPTSWLSWVLCDRGDVMITLRMESTMQVGSEIDGVVKIEETPMTDEQLNQILDCVDFSLKPDPSDLALLPSDPAPQTDEWENLENDAMSQTQDDSVEGLKMVAEPVKINAVRGWDASGKDCFQDVTLKSLILHPSSADLEFEEDAVEVQSYTMDKFSYVVLKDGRKIRIKQETYSGPMPLEEEIDLEEVDYVLMLDGTKLTPVG